MVAGQRRVELPGSRRRQHTGDKREVMPAPSHVGGLPVVEESDVRHLLHHSGQVSSSWVGGGGRLQHRVASVKILSYQDVVVCDE